VFSEKSDLPAQGQSAKLIRRHNLTTGDNDGIHEDAAEGLQGRNRDGFYLDHQTGGPTARPGKPDMRRPSDVAVRPVLCECRSTGLAEAPNDPDNRAERRPKQ
jgi:hypothetical protein